MRKILFGVWLTVASGLGIGARAATLADLFDNPVLARGKGVEVKRSSVEDAFTAYKANLAARGESVPEQARLAREAQMLDRLIVTQILTNRATAADRAAAKDIAAKFLADAKKGAPTAEAFERQLTALGLTGGQFTERVGDQAVCQAVIDRELKPTLSVTDAQVKEFYETGTDPLVKALQEDLTRMAAKPETPPADLAIVKARIDDIKRLNLDRLGRAEQVRVSHVLFSTRMRDSDEELPDERKKLKRQQLERVRQRAVEGEDFAKLVEQYSEDRNLKETKGEYTFGRDDGLAPEFKAAAFSLELGKISDVITTVFGYHIIKLLEKTSAQKSEFKKVEPEIRAFLLEQELQKRLPEFFAQLKKDAGVEILDAKYKLDLVKDTDPRK